MWKFKGEMVEVKKRDIVFNEKPNHAKHVFLCTNSTQESVRQLLSLPGWYFSVYPARRPLMLSGAPHSRVRESKPWLTTFRKAGGPGTEKKKIQNQS